MSKLEDLFEFQCKALGVPSAEREYRFNESRRWRADFAWPELKLIVEIHGGTWTNGRHNRARGLANDLEKSNAAQLGGWLYLAYTGDDVKSGKAVNEVVKVVGDLRPVRCGRR